MKSGKPPLVAPATAFALAMVFWAAPARAHTPHTCPADLPDEPVLSSHIEHGDILAGRVSFEEIAAHGEALFNGRFNRCDGQGRPRTESTGEAPGGGGAPADEAARP